MREAREPEQQLPHRHWQGALKVGEARRLLHSPCRVFCTRLLPAVEAMQVMARYSDPWPQTRGGLASATLPTRQDLAWPC